MSSGENGVVFRSLGLAEHRGEKALQRRLLAQIERNAAGLPARNGNCVISGSKAQRRIEVGKAHEELLESRASAGAESGDAWRKSEFQGLSMIGKHRVFGRRFEACQCADAAIGNGEFEGAGIRTECDDAGGGGLRVFVDVVLHFAEGTDQLLSDGARKSGNVRCGLLGRESELRPCDSFVLNRLKRAKGSEGLGFRANPDVTVSVAEGLDHGCGPVEHEPGIVTRPWENSGLGQKT